MKPMKPKSKNKPPATALDIWRQQRKMTQEQLARKAGLSRQAVCDACNYSPSEAQLPRLARALHVAQADIHPDREPSAALEQEQAFSQTVDTLIKELRELPPQLLDKKVDAVLALLAMEDFEDDFREALRCLLKQYNAIALCYITELVRAPSPASDSAGSQPVSNLPDKDNRLDIYMKQRDLRVNELASRTGLSRQTISQAKKDSERLGKMKKDNLQKLARELKVQVKDLVPGEEPDAVPAPVIDVQKKIDEILQATRLCLPGHLEEKVSFIRLYIKDGDAHTDLLMKYLCQDEEPRRRENVLKLLPALADLPYFQADHVHDIQIGYYLTDDESAYMAFVLFEPWVYDIFNLKNPYSLLAWPDRDTTASSDLLPDELPRYALDCSVEIPVDDQDPEYDPESDIYDQVDDYLWTSEAETILEPWLKNVFEEFLTDNLPQASMCQYTFEDMELGLPVRLYLREQQYRELAARVISPASLTPRQLTALTKVFSRLREDPDSERRILSRYHVPAF